MSEQLLPPSPCHCQAQVKEWKEKYSKLEEKRGALRQAVKLLEQQIDKVQAENLSLKKAYEQERERVGKEGEERELALRVPLENEISSLKSEISSLQQQVASGAAVHGDEKVSVLEAKVTAGEKEINRLKELFKKEKARADSEKKNTESEKRRANEAWKIVAAEKSKAEEEKKILERKSEEVKLLAERQKNEADELRKKLGLETAKHKEMNKKLELERQWLNKERQHADTEKARAEEQRKLAEVNVKKLIEEKCRADNLSNKVEESSRMIEKLRKELSDLSTNMCVGLDGEFVNSMQHPMAVGAIKQQLEAERQKYVSEKKWADSEMRKAEKQKNRVQKYKRRALKEKCRGDQLSVQLNVERQRNQELQQKQLGISSTKPVEAPSGQPATDIGDESSELRILKKHLKLQKMRTKHAREVAELERFRHRIVQQEVQRIKLDFGQISQRLDMLDSCFVSSCDGIDDPKKNGNTEMQSWKKLYGLQSFPNELMKPYRAFVGDPTSGGISTDFISGTASKSELPPGGSHRKKLKRSGINSALASFSDRGLVGSQDKGDITVSTPARLLEDHLNQLTNASSPLDRNNRITANENTAVVAENNVRCPLTVDGAGVNKHGQKRKRLIDVVKSVDGMCLNSRKLHLQIEEELTTLHDMLMVEMERPVHDRGYLVDNDPQTQERFQNMCLNYQSKNKEQSNIQASLVANSCGQASDKAHVNILEERGDWEGLLFDDIMGSSKAIDGDYMKLLELDNPADEECYRLAIGCPLSPTLPEIYIERMGVINIDANRDTHQGVHSPVKNLSPSVELGINNREVDSCKLSLTFSGNQVGNFGNQQDYCHGIDTNRDMHQGVHCPVETLSPLVELGVNNMTVDSNILSLTFYENKEEKFSNQQGHRHGIIPRYFVGYCDTKDLESISRILCAIKGCIDRGSFVSNSGWSLRNDLIELKLEEKLPGKAKASAFFSILLLKFSAMRTCGLSLNGDSISCIDSFAAHLRDVISDVDTRSLLAELCSIGELLSLIEDFLVEGKLISCSETSSEKLTCDRGISIVLDGVNVLISSGAASADLLVAGSVVLAAMCTALDQIDFICEASYRIFGSHGKDLSVVLTILHVFAHISGGNYFTLRSYGRLMTVLKSLVCYLEGAADAGGSRCVLSQGEVAAGLQFSKCPFSDKAVPVDTIVSLLLEELQKIVISGEVVELINSTWDEVPPLRDNYEGIKGREDFQSLPEVYPGSSCLKNPGMTDAKSHNLPGANPYDGDSFLLVEFIAVNLGWEWTKTKILPELLKILESCQQERSAAAIIILLGQLGRLGVDSSGCNDTSVESLRCQLYSFLCQSLILNLGFPIQSAIVMALLSLLPLDFESILESDATLPETASLSIPVQAIRKWFSSLSKEEQASTHTIFQSTAFV